MSEETCPVCGSRNEPATEFCASCGAYIGWETGDRPPPAPSEAGAPPAEHPAQAAPPPSAEPHAPPAGHGDPDHVVRTSIHDKGIGGPPATHATSPAPPQQRGPAPTGERSAAGTPALDVHLEQSEAVVTPGGAAVAIDVVITNTSAIVEAYLVTVVDPPPWLVVAPGAARLLPGADGRARLLLSIREGNLVPAGHALLSVRVQGESDQAVRVEAPLGLLIGSVHGPVTLRLEPSILRANDTTMGLFRLVIDNRSSNEPLGVTLTGRDPEQQARFWFSDAAPVVPAAGQSAVRLRVDVPALPPDTQLNRTLTVVASDARREFEATANFVQSTSPTVVDPPVLLGLSPSVVHERNGATVATVVTADNRRGGRPHHLTIGATDDEKAVRFTVTPAELDVPPGQVASARIRMHAHRPDGVREASRPFTVSAWDGADLVQAEGTLVQSASDRRPLARVLLTLLGAAMMAIGAFRLWTSDPRLSGNEWDVSTVTTAVGGDVRVLSDAGADLGILDTLVNGATIVLLFAVAALLGLIGSSGRLTRVAALLCLVFLGALFVAVVLGPDGTPYVSGQMTWVLVGCVIAFIGGMLGKRGRPAPS